MKMTRFFLTRLFEFIFVVFCAKQKPQQIKKKKKIQEEKFTVILDMDDM